MGNLAFQTATVSLGLEEVYYMSVSKCSGVSQDPSFYDLMIWGTIKRL